MMTDLPVSGGSDADRKPHYDAIVVGSGITGGWAAKELTEGGLETLLLERGRPVVHGADYTGEHVNPWELPYRGQGNRQLYEREYPVQSQCYAFGEDTRHFFVKDSEHPYGHDEDKPFRWIRGYHLGGTDQSPKSRGSSRQQGAEAMHRRGRGSL